MHGLAINIYNSCNEQSCHLHSISDGDGAFTAHGRQSRSEDTGFSFVRCHLTGIGVGKCILGRPWRDYARVVFALCNISNTVSPVGWKDWGRPESREYVRGFYDLTCRSIHQKSYMDMPCILIKSSYIYTCCIYTYNICDFYSICI